MECQAWKVQVEGRTINKRVDHIINLAADLAGVTRSYFRSNAGSWRQVHRNLMDSEKDFDSTRFHIISLGEGLNVVIDFETGELLALDKTGPVHDSVVLALALDLHWNSHEAVLRRIQDGSFSLAPA